MPNVFNFQTENGVNGHQHGNDYQSQNEQVSSHSPTKRPNQNEYAIAVHPNRNSQLNSHRYRAPIEARIEAEVMEDHRREMELR